MPNAVFAVFFCRVTIGIVQDYLVEYSQIFKPVKEKPKEKARVSSFMAQPEAPEEDIKPEFALEFLEKRFLWFQNMLTEIQKKFPDVFPPYWNLEYHLTKNFLRRVSSCMYMLCLKAVMAHSPSYDLGAYNLFIDFLGQIDAKSFTGIIQWTHEGSRRK